MASMLHSRGAQSSFASNTLPEFVVIEFPGFVKNMDKALEALGGLQNISAAHVNNRLIELRHRPVNIYAIGLHSERSVADRGSFGSGTLHCVLKVRRRKKPGPEGPQVESKIIGTVAAVYTFKTMCDFQYLPLLRVGESNIFENLTSQLVPTSLHSALSWWNQPSSKEDTPLFLPPFQYSRYNMPTAKLLCKEADFSLEKIKKRTCGHGQSLRTERKAHSVTVHGSQQFPSAPSEEAVKEADSRCKSEEAHRLLFDLFDERPMWTRVAIMKKTNLDEPVLKVILQKYAFYILNGPWGRLWCRFGYDPRIDPKARIYQTVMVTFRQHSKIPERQRLKIVNAGTVKTPKQSYPRGSMSITSALNTILNGYIDYTYTPGELPRVRQMWYSLCDIRLPIAEDYVRREFFAQGDRADEQNGWLPPKAIERIRIAIKEDVNNLSCQIDELEEGMMMEEIDEDWWYGENSTE